MKPVGIISGLDGRLFCQQGIVAFVSRADASLLRTINGAAKHDTFDAILTHLKDRHTDVPEFIVVDRDAGTLLIHGTLSVHNGATEIASQDAETFQTTWLKDFELRHDPLGLDSTPLTFLHDGCIPAAGFILKPKATAKITDPDEDRPTPPNKSGRSKILDDPGIDLAAIGRREPATTEPVEADRAEHAEPASSQEPRPRKVEKADSKVEAHRPMRKFRTPPQPTKSQTPHEPEARSRNQMAKLRFSDGQSQTIATGLLVGRYPTKNGVPKNYDTVTIAGDEVSRVHLELMIEDGALFGLDCSTANGSSIRSNHGMSDLATTKPGSRLEPGDVIEFGGQRIFFDGWSTDD